MTRNTTSRFGPSIRYVLKGLLITALLMLAKIGLEQTPPGIWIEQRTYALLTRILPAFREKGQSVIVIDISHLPGGTPSLSAKPVPTSREKLKALLDTLVTLQPRAVAIDIDFSPDQTGWIVDQDPSFFDHCLQLSKQAPIILGIYRTVREPKAVWLGIPKYAPLAASLWVSDEGLERAPAWIQAPGVDDRLPSLGAALAHARYGERNGPLHWLQPWVHQLRERTVQTERNPDGLRIGEVLVNYSNIGQLISETILVTEASELPRHADKIQGRMVLLGSIKGASDLFDIPVLDHVQPGVFVHGSMAFTLASEPVYELNHNVRLVLDILISLLILLAVVKARHGRFDHSSVALEQATSKVLFRAVGLVLLVGCLTVYAVRIFWLDFLLVILFLLVHPAVERRLHRARHPAHDQETGS